MFNYLKQIWNTKDLRKKILFTLGLLLIYRLLAQVTVPGANLEALEALRNSATSGVLQIFSLLTGGSTESFSIVLMGIGPYINAVIIMQLLQVISPKLEAISNEGETGRRKINSYTRWLTLPLAFLQSFGLLVLLNSQTGGLQIVNTAIPEVLIPMLTITAGTLLLVWMGELITEKGIGNGISMIIFTSIMSQVPGAIASGVSLSTGDQSAMITFITVILITIALIVAVVLVSEGQRKVPLTYAGRGVQSKADQAFLPIKINQAGMIPIIFAVAMVSFPGIVGALLSNAQTPAVSAFGQKLATLFQAGSMSYVIGYLVLTVAFTYFYVSISFKPEQIAENIQKRGGYIPGIRPGTQTVDYLKGISNRLTLFGAIFLGTIAVIPILINTISNTGSITSITSILSGAGIIIIVGVVLELLRQVNASMVMHDYKKFY